METKEITDVSTSTLENNKLIAEFMGLNLLKDTKHWHRAIEGLSNEDMQLYCINENKSNWYSRLLIDLEYPTSWDWLMPAVERCFTIDLPIDVDNHYFRINDALLTINISEVYKAVIEFIKWYNLNK